MTPWSGPAFVIGEAGVNHNGDIDTARRLVDAAKAAGCNAVKFQSFRAAALVSRSQKMADYQQANTGGQATQHDMLVSLELSDHDHEVLKTHAADQGIVFFSTAFDLERVDFLASLDIPVWKVPSGEINNYPYLVKIAGLGKPVILSTGMATIAEIDQAVTLMTDSGLPRSDLCILHCNTEYPTPWTDVNLTAMVSLRYAFGAAVGYSDHTNGIEIPIAAIALGARVIEKHFTLDRSMPGPDHKASLEPAELQSMVECIRNVELAMGDGIKRPTPSERKNIDIARKVVVASRAIRAGETLGESNLTAKRAGRGISPMRWPELMGRRASRDFAADEIIEL